MPHRAHLFSLRIAHSLREVISEGYTRQAFLKDVLAGCVVGVIAIPLAMALAIASGVAPQYGLYTAIIAGFVIALTGGSRFSVSGPTAAFVVILLPIVNAHGLAGLLVASVMAGVILVAMAYARLGRFIEYIPESVTLGFTGGIGIVIATLQIPDVLGLATQGLPEHYYEKIIVIGSVFNTIDLGSVLIAVFTLAVMLVWPKFKTPIPPHLTAVILASVFTYLLNQHGFNIATIGSRFHFVLADGTAGGGIPPVLPHFEWPWLRTGINGISLTMNWDTMRELIPAAFAIAMLGAIESLLCAVVLDGMSGKRHSANSELLGQGIGNIITPFFGGITATAAIARSTANFKSGARSPVAAMTHGVIILLSLVLFAPTLKYLPMPALAAMLLVVAWNMSEAPKSLHLVKTSPRGDIAVFATCLGLTVWFDMVIAISVGIVLASILFMREIASMTRVVDISENKKYIGQSLPQGWKAIKINGPLFFAAADRVFGEVNEALKGLTGIILHVDAVPILDAGGLASLTKLINAQAESGKKIYFAEWQFQPLKTLAKARITLPHNVRFFANLEEAQNADLEENQNVSL